MLPRGKCNVSVKRSLIFFLSFSIGTSTLAQQSDNIDQQISLLKIKNHKLYSNYQQPKNSLEAYLWDWSPSELEEAEKWFASSEYFPEKLKKEIEWYESEYEADKANWDLIISTTGISEDLKSSYLQFLKDENRLFLYYKIYWGNKLHAFKMYGGDWVEEFTNECIEDFGYTFIATLKNVLTELKKCLSAPLSEFNKNISFQAVARNFDPTSDNLNASIVKLYGCIGKIPRRSVTYAIQAALKRQFIKEMNEKGVDDLVASYWWEAKIMKNKDLGIFEKVVDDMKKLDFWGMNIIEDKMKQWAADEVMPQIREETNSIIKEQYKKQIIDKGLAHTAAAQAFKEKSERNILKKAMAESTDHIYNQLYQSFEFAFENIQQLYTMYTGYNEFQWHIERELVLYRHTRQCLAKRGIPVTPEKMLEIMMKDEKSILAWHKENCNEHEVARKEELKKLLEKIVDNEELIDMLVNEIVGRCSKVSSLASAAGQALTKSSLSGTRDIPDMLFEKTKTTVEQWISKMEAIKSKALQNAVAAGIYKTHIQRKAIQTCDDILTIADAGNEAQQLGAAMGSLANMSDALDYSSNVSIYFDQNQLYFLTAREIQTEIVSVINNYHAKFSNTINTALPEQEITTIVNLYDKANGLYHTNIETMELLEDEMVKFNANYNAALPLLTNDEKTKGLELNMLHKRLTKRVNDARRCHASCGSQLQRIESALMAIRGAGLQVTTQQPNPELSGYVEKSLAILHEIEAQLDEVKTYRIESDNAVRAARGCMNKLVNILPAKAATDMASRNDGNNVSKNAVSGGGFVEISQSDTISENHGDSDIDPEVQTAIDEYYQARRLSNYGRKGFSQDAMQILINNMVKKNIAENQQAIDDLNNIAADMIKKTATYYSNQAQNKVQHEKSAEEEYSEKMLKNPYKKYYEAFNIDPAKIPDDPWGLNTDSEGSSNPGYTDDAINLMGVSAAPYDIEPKDNGSSSSYFGGGSSSSESSLSEGHQVSTGYLEALMEYLKDKHKVLNIDR